MMIEIMLVEGISDVLLISYYLQNIYGWKYEHNNTLNINPLNKYEHIETLSKNGNQLILCGVGGNGKFAHFVDQHRINNMIIEKDISSLMIVTDRDNASDLKIEAAISKSLKNLTIKANKWINNPIFDSFGQTKTINTYLLIIPENKKGALERVIIDSLKDIPKETNLICKVTQFIDLLKQELVPERSEERR